MFNYTSFMDEVKISHNNNKNNNKKMREKNSKTEKNKAFNSSNFIGRVSIFRTNFQGIKLKDYVMKEKRNQEGISYIYVHCTSEYICLSCIDVIVHYLLEKITIILYAAQHKFVTFLRETKNTTRKSTTNR